MTKNGAKISWQCPFKTGWFISNFIEIKEVCFKFMPYWNFYIIFSLIFDHAVGVVRLNKFTMKVAVSQGFFWNIFCLKGSTWSPYKQKKRIRELFHEIRDKLSLKIVRTKIIENNFLVSLVLGTFSIRISLYFWNQ